MPRELGPLPMEGEPLTETQALMEQAGFGPDARSFDRLSKMADLARTFLWQIAQGRSLPSDEQRERLVSASVKP